jgi:hypothetical protein
MVATKVNSEGHCIVFKENSVVYQCQCCTKLQLDLSEAVSELKSAKQITKILHEEINTARSLECTQTGSWSIHNDQLNATTCDETLEEISTQVPNAATTWKQYPWLLGNSVSIMKIIMQQCKPIPVITNRYAILDGARSEGDMQEQPPEQQYKTETTCSWLLLLLISIQA